MANLTSNETTSTTGTGDHSLTALLSLPMDFSIDPLMTFQNTTSGISNNEVLFPLTSELVPMLTSDDNGSTSSSPSMTSLSSVTMTSSPLNNNLPSPMIKKKVNNTTGTKKARLSLEDKDQKTKERILRNRAAAQESRDRKRKYVADLEDVNQKLTTENDLMNKRMKLLELENQQLQQQLAAFAQQLTQLHQLKSSDTSSLFSHGFCDSARIVIKELPFLPAAEVMKQNNEDSEDDQETIVQDLYMPSPMLSPPISSSSECETDDEPISPPQHIELDELFDWDGQQII